MGSLRVVVTSPRIPAGLLSASAWDAIRSASVVVATDPADPLARAVGAAGVDVAIDPGVVADDLLRRAAGEVGEDIVWLLGDREADTVARTLADDVVGRAERGDADLPDIE